MGGAQAEGPVDHVEHQEQDGEHHQEHVVHLGPVVIFQLILQSPDQVYSACLGTMSVLSVSVNGFIQAITKILLEFPRSIIQVG